MRPGRLSKEKHFDRTATAIAQRLERFDVVIRQSVGLFAGRGCPQRQVRQSMVHPCGSTDWKCPGGRNADHPRERIRTFWPFGFQGCQAYGFRSARRIRDTRLCRTPRRPCRETRFPISLGGERWEKWPHGWTADSRSIFYTSNVQGKWGLYHQQIAVIQT